MRGERGGKGRVMRGSKEGRGEKRNEGRKKECIEGLCVLGEGGRSKGVEKRGEKECSEGEGIEKGHRLRGVEKERKGGTRGKR